MVASLQSWRIVAILVVLVAGCMGMGAAGTEHAATVSHKEYLAVDDAELYVIVRGEHRDAPMLVWLHGGPGGAERPLFRYFNGDLESHFLVAYLDQRGAGRSFDADADPGRLTVKQHIADLDRVIDHLRQTFGKDKVILIGHSWGAALGLLYARDHPDKVATLVGVSPLIFPSESQQLQHEYIRETALERDDQGTLSRLNELGPPPYKTASDMLRVEALADDYGAIYHTRPNRFLVMMGGLFRGLVTPWEIPKLIRANNVSLEAMHEEIYDLDLTNSVQELTLPVHFLLGRYDRHVDAELARTYLEQLSVPAKTVIWFEESAHNPPFEEPARFNRAVTELLLEGEQAGRR